METVQASNVKGDSEGKKGEQHKEQQTWSLNLQVRKDKVQKVQSLNSQQGRSKGNSKIDHK